MYYVQIYYKLMSGYLSLNHEKYRMCYHLIFSTKYRLRLLNPIKDDLFASFRRAEAMQKLWHIRVLEADLDHVHFLIEATPAVRIADIVHSLKQCSTYDMWRTHHDYLIRFYWREHALWTRGYFCATIGEVSEQRLMEYIENQG